MKHSFPAPVTGALVAAALLLPATLAAQPPAATPAPTQQQQQQTPRRQGGFVPGQKRAAEDPAQVDRGKSVYGIACRACHGADLRGGDMGGPNLLRSPLTLVDRDGEKIVPVINGSLAGSGMPAIPMSAEDAKAVSAYIRSVMGTIGGQGMPPSSKAPETIVVGNAAEGKAYFQAKCASCHSVDGDLKGIATRIADAKTLQNTWVAGAGRQARRGGGASTAKPVTVKVNKPGNGGVTEGRLVRIDAFSVSLELADGTIRSFRRDGDSPKVEVNDPLEAHRKLLPLYLDKNIHDVTAYLVTIK